MSTDPLFMKVGGQYYWYHNDHLGTPQMMTTSSGAVVWKAKYSSLGKATVDPSSTVINPFRLPGQYEDAETGLYYNWFRYYDADISRYLSVDPLRISNLRLLIQSYYNGLLRDLSIFSKEKAKGLLSVYFVYLNKTHNPEQLDEYSYAINNPVNWVDPLGLWTFAVRLNLTVIFGDVTVGLVFDDKGNFGLQFTGSYGFSPSVGLSIGGTKTDAPCINALEGPSTSAGSAFNPWPGMGFEVNHVTTSPPNRPSRYEGYDVGFGIGVGTPIAPQMFTGTTTTLAQGRYR